MPHNIRDYYSLFSEKSVARPNRFQAVIGLPQKLTQKYGNSIREISLLVESAEVPGWALNTIPYSATSPAFEAVVGMQYDSWNVRFRLMDDFLVKDVFDDWLNLIINPQTRKIGFRSDYIVDASVSPLDLNNQAIKTIILQDLYPQAVDTIGLDNTSENTYMTVGVRFTYRKWT
jgi:hypothetical protein